MLYIFIGEIITGLISIIYMWCNKFWESMLFLALCAICVLLAKMV